MIVCALFRKKHVAKVEHEKEAKLEAAEAEMKDLKQRSDRAVSALTERQRRNHWQESVDRLIQGGLG